MKVLNSQTIDKSTKSMILALLDEMQESNKEFSDFEKGFLSDFAEKLEKWGDKTFMSEKQRAVIEKMYSKYIGG